MDYLTATISTILSACVEARDPLAWVEFQRRYNRAIALAVLRVCRSFNIQNPDLADDLIQETYLKLCANGCRILRESRTGNPESVGALLKKVAHSVAIDHFRAETAKKRGAGTVDSGLDQKVEVSHTDDERSIERGLLLEQIRGFLEDAESPAGSERDLTVFWLYYRTGLTSKAIAALPTVSLTQKGVESLILRMTRYVRERTAGGSGRRLKENAVENAS